MQAKAFRPVGIGFCLLALFAFLAPAHSADPHIDRILRTNIVGKPQVEIHFASDANRTYLLQSINALPCPNCNTNTASLTNWSNFQTGYSLPFTNHWIFYDTRTNQ